MDEYEDEFFEEEDDRGADCGRWINSSLGHWCAMAGTEFCDFECPYRG